MLFSTKNRKKKIGTLGIQYGDVKIKQYSKVTNLGCQLDELVGGGYGINKINDRLNSFTGKTNLTPYLKRLLCNVLIQPHFDYSCSA